MECPRDGTPTGLESSTDEVWESTVRKDVMVGQKLGEYVVRRRIGSGGMGVVYEGEHPVIGRKVAIKIIRPDSSEGVRSRDLIDEARAASAIRHRGIIDIFGFGTLPGIGQYLVMEFLNGRPLDEVILDRAPMRAAEVIRPIIEVLGALGAAHAEGVIHRDLKPGNIFVVLESNGTEYVKVLDFGLAKRGAAPNSATPQTRVSMIVGTPEYMAPEQACGQSVSPRTDLYAVGIIMFEMLTGRLPFRGDSAMHTAIMQVQTPPPSPSKFVDGLPPELEDLILRLLAKEPDQRPASADLVARELKAIAKMLAVEMTQLSGFARAVSEPTSEPVSAVRAQARQGAPGAAAQRGGTRQPVAASDLETAAAPRTHARPALSPPPPEVASRSAPGSRPAAPARAQAARPQPARAPVPRTQLLTEEPPREVRSGAKVPDTDESVRSPRPSRGVKPAVAVGVAALLICAGMGLVMLRSNEGPSVPLGSERTVSKGPTPLDPVVVPPPAPKEEPNPKEEPKATTVSLQQPPSPREPAALPVRDGDVREERDAGHPADRDPGPGRDIGAAEVQHGLRAAEGSEDGDWQTAPYHQWEWDPQAGGGVLGRDLRRQHLYREGPKTSRRAVRRQAHARTARQSEGQRAAEGDPHPAERDVQSHHHLRSRWGRWLERPS